MKLAIAQRISNSVIADVFRSLDGERVYKLYRRITDPRCAQDPPRLFQNELIGYEAAMRSEGVRDHVPRFHGRTEITEIINSSGQSVMGEYHGECCLELEFIAGECRKIGEIPEECEQIAVALMESIGQLMRCSFDGSFFNWCDKCRIVVIDFAPNV